jgi:hypothetical protein
MLQYILRVSGFSDENMIIEKLVIQIKLTSTYSLELRAGQKSSNFSLQACGGKKALVRVLSRSLGGKTL